MGFADIQIVVFDLDDTLCSEKEFVKSGFHAVSDYVKESGIARQELFTGLWKKFLDGARGTVFNEALAEAGIEPAEALIKKLVEVYRSHRPDIALYPDARAVLQQIRGRKKTGLLSDGYLQTQKNKVDALGIESFFDIIVFTDSMGREFWKPHPAGFEKIMAACSLSGAACLYVGDNPLKDFYGAKKLGWCTAQIQRDDGVYAGQQCPPDSDYQADIVIGDLCRISSIIGLST